MTWTPPSRSARSSGCIAVLWMCAACASPDGNGPGLTPPPAVGLDRIAPLSVVPGTRLILSGKNFSTTVQQLFRLNGTGPNGVVEVSAPVSVVGPERGEVEVDSQLFAAVGPGAVVGEASVDSENAAGKTPGHRLPVTLQFRQHLDPMLADVGDGLVHFNSRVPVVGDGFLLGQEGQTQVELVGCFLPEGSTGDCGTVGAQIQVKLPVTPKEDGTRRSGTFEFRPSISGLKVGTFDGKVSVINRHPDGVERRSAAVNVSFQLGRTLLHRLDPDRVAVGQYLDIQGAGFVGGEEGSTLIHFSGSFAPKGGTPRQVELDLVPGYKHGGWLQEVLEDSIGLGSVIKLRRERGVLSGTWTPTVFWNSKSLEGLPIQLSLSIAPVKQVAWVRFTNEWQDGLRHLGLQAADQQVRARILEVMRVVYAGLNVEFREDEPQDFKLYAKLDLGGKDPNGIGLLGYDNTPGKDVDNMRLYDWLGGVNAMTQQDGYPGYGGVFLVSLLGFSEHPPSGVYKSPLSCELFDDIFDPFRPDRGEELTAAEALAAGTPTTTSGCPANAGDRMAQARCAIRVLGNAVGHTAAHELGHSLGLADPYGAPTAFHNPGDLPNRLMEGGQGRDFEERAELNGKGPAVFCDEEYLYLKKILPLDPPQDPPVKRPGCY